jgi:hypothetical protein
MATLDEGLYTYLSTFAGLTALVSTRVYAFKLPQGATLPAVTFQRISTPRSLTHDTSGVGNDLARPRFQFDAWATTYSSAKAISDQIRAALNGKKGTIATGVTINAAMVEDERPAFEPETNIYQISCDYFIWHTD